MFVAMPAMHDPQGFVIGALKEGTWNPHANDTPNRGLSHDSFASSVVSPSGEV